MNTSETPWSISHLPTAVDWPKTISSKKPHTVGGNTMGMVKTESSTPLMRLVVPMVRQAASSPSANETASATPAVLIDTHSGR